MQSLHHRVLEESVSTTPAFAVRKFNQNMAMFKTTCLPNSTHLN